MKIGVSAAVGKAAIAHAAGFDYLEENIQNFLVPEQPDAVFAENLKASRQSPLSIPSANCFLPGALKCVGPDIDEKRLDRYAQVAFKRAGHAGLRLLVFGSGGARNIPDGFSHDQAREQMVAYLRRIAPVAEAEGVTIVIEPLNRKECNFINTLNEGASIVNELDHTHVRLLADIYHMRMDDEPADAIVKHARLLAHVHVAEKEGRAAPGTSGEDFAPYLDALREGNYRGAISYECGWKDFAAQAADSLKSFRAQVRRAGLDRMGPSSSPDNKFLRTFPASG
jgi:sugar phosphate isomerase/epimerase